jgi:hypothetical protein
VCDEAVSLVDLPRLVESFVGSGCWPKIETEFAAISMPSVVRLLHQCDRGWHGCRSKTRKQIFNEDGSLWLDFDLADDPGETINRA